LWRAQNCEGRSENHRRWHVVDACREAAGADERFAVESTGLRNGTKLVGRVAREATAPAADMEAESSARGASPRFSAPMTDVVMPEECQSMPNTEPKA